MGKSNAIGSDMAGHALTRRAALIAFAASFWVPTRGQAEPIIDLILAGIIRYIV